VELTWDGSTDYARLAEFCDEQGWSHAIRVGDDALLLEIRQENLLFAIVCGDAQALNAGSAQLMGGLGTADDLEDGEPRKAHTIPDRIVADRCPRCSTALILSGPAARAGSGLCPVCEANEHAAVLLSTALSVSMVAATIDGIRKEVGGRGSAALKRRLRSVSDELRRLVCRLEAPKADVSPGGDG
jgi:hypothetical protein